MAGLISLKEPSVSVPVQMLVPDGNCMEVKYLWPLLFQAIEIDVMCRFIPTLLVMIVDTFEPEGERTLMVSNVVLQM